MGERGDEAGSGSSSLPVSRTHLRPESTVEDLQPACYINLRAPANNLRPYYGNDGGRLEKVHLEAAFFKFSHGSRLK